MSCKGMSTENVKNPGGDYYRQGGQRKEDIISIWIIPNSKSSTLSDSKPLQPDYSNMYIFIVQ